MPAIPVEGRPFTIVQESISDTKEAKKDDKYYYLCVKCETAIPSIPEDNGGCGCGNIFIDIDYFRLAVDDYSAFKTIEFSEEPS
jgi:hypothetical protein